MNTKTLTTPALSVIDHYLHFHLGSAVTSVPYFNNKSKGARVALRAYTGKGSPKELFDEAETIALKYRIALDSLSDEALKKILTDYNLGIDCSGLAYYILDAQSQECKKGSLSHKISFVNCHGIVGKLRCSFNPEGNCDVTTLAHEDNSRHIEIRNIEPGDMITMLAKKDESAERNHILVIHQVDYKDNMPIKIHYTHAVAYPEDGVYGTGLKQGTIEITYPEKSILDQHWSENNKVNADNRIFVRANNSITDLRRLNWF